jgi:hypothetical protein
MQVPGTSTVLFDSTWIGDKGGFHESEFDVVDVIPAPFDGHPGNRSGNPE